MLEKVMEIILRKKKKNNKKNTLPFRIFDYPIMGPEMTLWMNSLQLITPNTAGKIYSPTTLTLLFGFLLV